MVCAVWWHCITFRHRRNFRRRTQRLTRRTTRNKPSQDWWIPSSLAYSYRCVLCHQVFKFNKPAVVVGTKCSNYLFNPMRIKHLYTVNTVDMSMILSFSPPLYVLQWIHGSCDCCGVSITPSGSWYRVNLTRLLFWHQLMEQYVRHAITSLSTLWEWNSSILWRIWTCVHDFLCLGCPDFFLFLSIHCLFSLVVHSLSGLGFRSLQTHFYHGILPQSINLKWLQILKRYQPVDFMALERFKRVSLGEERGINNNGIKGGKHKVSFSERGWDGGMSFIFP